MATARLVFLLCVCLGLIATVQGEVFPHAVFTQVPEIETPSRVAFDAQCVFNTTYPQYLPWTVIPRHYQLNISAANPNTDAKMIFNGSVTIDLTVVQPTSCIVLSANLLTFGNVTLRVGQNTLNPQSVSFNQTMQFAIIQFSSVLPLGSAVLTITYVGQVNTVGAGFFISDNTFSPSDSTYPQTDEERKSLFRSYPNHIPHTQPALQTQATRKMYATQVGSTLLCFKKY